MSARTGTRSLGPAGVAFFVALCALAFSLALEPLFMTNDDAAIAMIGAGFGIASRPEPHLVFAQYGYGIIVGLLSRIIGPATHGWITLCALAGCLLLLVRAVFVARGYTLLGYLYGLILCCIFIVAMVEPQFTITSALLFVSGIAYALVMNAHRRLSSWGFVLVILILTFSAFIRLVAFAMSAAVVVPALLFLVWRDAERRRIACHLVAAIVLISVIGVASEWAAFAFSDGWSKTFQYNYFRAQFTDFARVPWVDGASPYRDMGWTRNDYDMFNHWYTHDGIFDMRQVSTIVEKVALPATQFKWDWISAWLKYPLESTPLLLSLGAQLMLLLSKRRDRFLCLLVIFGECVAVCAAAMTGRPPVLRVWAGIADTALIGLSAICLLSVAPDRNMAWQKAWLCIAGALSLWGLWSVAADHRSRVSEAHRYRDWLDQHRDFFAGKTVVWGGSLRFEFLVTPVRVYFPLPQTTMAPIGALSNTPMTSATLTAMGIKDLTNTLCQDTAVHLVAEPSSVETLVKFCVQHEHVTPAYGVVSAFDSSTLYTLEKVAAVSGSENR